MRILVLGGTGFLGSRAVTALKAIPEADVQVASRRGPVVVDFTKPETFAAMAGFEFVIDLADATTFSPDALAEWCLNQGLTFVECSSDARVVEGLHAVGKRVGKGQLILGGGIFTGVSNLLGRDVAEAVAPAQSVTLAISTSPYSGGGKSVAALMAGALATPQVAYVNGKRTEVPIQKGPGFELAPNVVRPTLKAPFPEAYMLHASTKAPNVEVLFSPRPSLLVTAFASIPAFIAKAAWFGFLMRMYFQILRGVLLRSVPSRVELAATATSSGATARRWVSAEDGMMAGAWGLAGAIAELGAFQAGTFFLDDRVRLEPVVGRANALAQTQVLVLSALERSPASRVTLDLPAPAPRPEALRSNSIEDL